MKNSRKSFLSSVLVLVLCVAMFIGTTFAWFTDNVTSSSNIIKSGNLDLEMYWTDDLDSNVWYDVEDPEHNTIFNHDNWEPGYTEVRYIKLVNAGNLALNYKLALTPMGNVGKLAEVINVFYANDGVEIEERSDLSNLNSIGLLNNVMDGGATANGTLLAENQYSPLHDSREIVITLAMSMITTAGNEYQNESIGDGFTITALATQCPYEEDSFGSDYDSNAEYPTILEPGKVSVAVTPDNGKVATGGVKLAGEGISATVPEGVMLEEGTNMLTLSVKPLEHTTTDITTVNNEILIPMEVHVSGVSEDNTVPIVIELGEIMPKYLNMGNYTLYHVENGVNNSMTYVGWDEDFTAHNQFKYDPLTGEVVVAMASFSEVAVLADTANAWQGVTSETGFSGGDGSEANPYVIANADELAYMAEQISNDNEKFGAKYYQLISDLNFGGKDYKKLFYPIGYWKPGEGSNKAGETWYTYGGSFRGTFDGMGHTITGIYQNTWTMDGDYDNGYYNDAMGLFGYVNGGTIKNLTIDDFYSEGEFAPTGCVTAYAAGDATFENIAITNCSPQTYNTGVAGIVGWDNGGDTAEEASNYTFRNITVDDKTIISALWGSWDVAAAGIMGYLGEYSSANLENCHLAPTIDVYNDVCGNYQYYWYRYCGMVIGTVDKTDDNGKLDLEGMITASNCTVDFGTDRHEYYYCEFIDNSIASYTHDYQFSRITHSELNYDNYDTDGDEIIDDIERPENGDGIVCTHAHSDKTEVINGETVSVEDKRAVYIPFRQLFGGYGWGVDGVEEYENIDIAVITGSKTKFDSLFKNNGTYLYRVGNDNPISLGALFEAVSDETISDSGVYVSVDKVEEDLNVSGVFTPNTSDWTKGTIQFAGTGVVKLTIQDYNFCIPTVLYLEVVDATNVTTATSATDKNVVLLNDVTGGFIVSNGYAVYGNGFKVTCSGNGSYGSKALSYGFVTVENGGILDNVQVLCDIFPESYLYTGEMTADSSGRYPYAYSAVAITGNSTISNSYICGARNNIFVGSGNVTIENTVTECGSLSNIQIKSSDAYTVTLDDVTTIQYQTSSEYNTSKTVLGFGVVVGDNESASNPTINLTGDLKQYNWVTNADTSVSNSYAKTAIGEALKVTDYQYTIGGNTTVNMGIAYLNAQTANITDERSNKDEISYKLNNITMSGQTGQVYSITKGNSSIAEETRYDAGTDGVIPYKPTINKDILPIVTFTGVQNNSVKFETLYDSTQGGWINKLVVDLDNHDGGSYDFNFSDLKVQKYGIDLDFVVKDADGNTVKKDSSVTLNQLFTGEYTLEVTDNLLFGAYGNKVENKTVMRACPLILNATKTSIEPPKFTNAGTATAIRLVTSSGGDWRPAYTVLTGVSVEYWSTSEGSIKTVDLSTLYNSGTISSNVWTYTCDDYTLTITGGAVHSDGSVITPVVANNTLYFASTNKAFGTGTTSRNIVLAYVFTDKNASTTWNRTETVTYSELSEYDYNSFKNNGTLTEPSSSSCVTPDTLITLADGSQVRVDSLTGNEQLLVWNMETGKLDSAPIMFVDSEAQTEVEVIKLYFADGTEVKVISEHGFWDYDLNRYVYLDRDATEYIGHTFAKQNGDKLEKVALVDVVLENQVTTAWSPVTAGHLCYFVNDMLSMPGGVGGLFNIFDVDAETMTYDYEAMARDIETYGLFTYEELAQYAELSREMFDAAGGQYLKVSIGKGNMTEEELIAMIERYGKYFD